MVASILVVHPDAVFRSDASATLRAAGYAVSEASTFEHAKSLLDDRTPDLLIAGVRLGAFNGLHLVVRGRSMNPRMSAIVVAEPSDRLLASEASRFGAFLVADMPTGEALLAIVALVLEPSVT
jgi:DNA-binding NtrC family response regulator